MSLPTDQSSVHAFGAPEADARRLERWVLRHLCEPLLPHIPRSVHPNVLSLLTHAVSWLTLGLAVVSPGLPRGARVLALVGAAVGTLLSMLGDCLDGMHARRTAQCSKLGEILDHFLDTLVVPMSALGLALAMEMPAWGVLANTTGAAMVYHGQLLLYHRTGEFLHPDSTSGVEAQFGTAGGYLALAGVAYFDAFGGALMQATVLAIAAAAIAIQLGIARFYYVRLRGALGPHYYFIALCTATCALGMAGDGPGLLLTGLLLVLISLRILGTYVLRAVLEAPFDGVDRVLSALVFAGLVAGWLLPGARLLGPLQLSAQTLAGVAVAMYVLGRSALDLGAACRSLTARA